MSHGIKLFSIRRWRQFGPLRSAMLALIVWTAHAIGWLDPVERFVYDHYLRGSIAITGSPAKVLLVSVDDEEPLRDADRAWTLVETLRDLGAARILFTFVPDVEASFFERTESAPNVILGRHLERHPLRTTELRLAPLPAAAHGYLLQTAAVHIEPPRGGLHRFHRAWYVVDGREERTLEGRLLDDPTIPSVPDSGVFGVYFQGKTGSLPQVRSRRVIDGGLIPELVEGRTVVVGRVSRNPGAGVVTPTTHDYEKMSLLEYHGNAANTLLSGQVRQPLGPMGSLILIALTTVAMGVLIRWCDATFGTWILSIGFLSALAVSFVAFVFQQIWLP
ncbi:MAG: CHASE2 domain-containing protein, partial [Planctomycetota bacterium]